MCLAVPGEIVEIAEVAGEAAAALRTGRVAFGGVMRQVCLAYVPEARVGDYVIVHAGFAIAQLDEAHAREVLEQLARLGAAGGDADGDAGDA